MSENKHRHTGDVIFWTALSLSHIPAGLELMGELGCLVVLVMRVLLLLKKLRRMPHFRDSSKVLFPAPE